ncbi:MULTISPECIES: hypothetical protein [unclassified Campylobacter]|uniref:hypothetical protein n=1 Tax=unclassified Campylobacter TaxID=2593542 RepID=UPI001D263CF2|nr:hypothetical protein [Campylobacter sp. RM12651]MBZ7984681.1 hypothetical protein [Campylobacter sp. RM12647]MBZ7993357.1 hypothetical protein [Campylobacter sp. RM9333]ULO02789.1 hypothetical protein AVBRAN_0314 [Campylobacter sp. RM12651]
MKKAVLAILALGFITNASAYYWYDYFTGSGPWRWAFISAERDRVTPTRQNWSPNFKRTSSSNNGPRLNAGFVIR